MVRSINLPVQSPLSHTQTEQQDHFAVSEFSLVNLHKPFRRWITHYLDPLEPALPSSALAGCQRNPGPSPPAKGYGDNRNDAVSEGRLDFRSLRRIGGQEVGFSAEIQKAFRGFLVRKSIKSIASIKREVEEIELKLSQSDTVELIWKDAKERLRVNETLMALLFKLDSIRGFDTGVRDCRKTVIKKAIALQERVDEIVSVNRAENTVVQTLDVRGSAEKEAICVSQTLELKDSNRTPEDEGEVANSGDYANKVSKIAAEVDGSTVSDNAVEEAVSVNENNCSEKIVHCLDALAPVSIESESDQVTTTGDLEGTAPEVYEKMDVSEQACAVKQVVEDPNDETLPRSEHVEENVETIPKEHSPNPQSGLEELGEEENMIAEGRDDNKCNRELLGRMMEDNEKMMNMMRQLYDRNERQTRMLNSLTQRVEQLEKAFICDKLRRKKKRQSTGTMDGSESTPDQKKCGKN